MGRRTDRIPDSPAQPGLISKAFSRDALQAGFRLAGCLIRPTQNCIVRGDAEAVHVEPRVMEVLVCLAERAGEVVSREVLHQKVWGGLVVTDQAVTNCISELRQRLGDDRSTRRIIETISKRGYRLVAPVELADARTVPERLASSTPWAAFRRGPEAGAAALLVFVLVGFAWSLGGNRDPALASVAVLQFENAAGVDSLDYLGFALPDEIATLLTRSPSLAVRPIGYLDTDNALAQAQALGVGHVISGRYYLEDGDQLTVAVEAQVASQERVVWRARITVPAGDLLAMRARLTERVHEGLLPVLGATADSATGPMPAHDEAYRLYLHSLAMPYQPKPTERAIDMLKQVVALDPAFALAWVALGGRYYDHGTYGPGGEQARGQAMAAYRKGLELDPDLISAAAQIVTVLTETGDLETAYREGARLVDKFDASAEAHFALAYVYRFGGLLEASQRHCDLALERDPNNPRFRSCGYAYLYDGKLSRVMDFLALDEGSYFAQWGTVLYHLRRRDDVAALGVVRQAAPDPTRQLMEPCLEGQRGLALDEASAAFVQYWQRQSDPEMPYAVAPMLSHCGYPEEALGFLERSVDANFCAYPAADRDPVWADFRGHPQFQRIRAKAIACHDRFLRMVDAHTEATGDQSR
jgi:DNA-binding winged helix-turn-helix (wHTH) protein/tetratricopeptide (TPR) repeat protein